MRKNLLVSSLLLCAAASIHGPADMACPTRIDDNSYQNVWKSGGKPTLTAKAVVWDLNKTLTITQTPTDAAVKGSVAAYDRQ